MPILLWQGIQTRRRVPRVPEAAGPQEGKLAGMGQPLHLLLIGESTIAGVGARTHQVGLAGQTAVYLRQQLGRPIHWQAMGQSGILAREVRTQLLPKIKKQPNVIVIGLGVNDVTHFSSHRQWRDQLRGIIRDLTLTWGHLPILMSGLPPMHNFPALPQPLRWYLGQRAGIHDSIARQICADFPNVIYLPIPDLTSPHFFCRDGFHPSELGYAKWGEILAATVCQPAVLNRFATLSKS